MALRNIMQEGEDILRKTCRPVTEITERTKMILDDMKDTMIEYNGVGVAAPQVGVMRRMFVAMPDPENAPDEILYFINPEIIESSGDQFNSEACLSVPDLLGDVHRPTYVKIRYLNIDGNEETREFKDFGATVICHENDHLDGILYIDKAENIREPAPAENVEENA